MADLVGNWGGGDGSTTEEGTDPPARKTLPDAKKKKLLAESTWSRDASLIELATQLRHLLGDELFTDHNKFLRQVDGAVKTFTVKPNTAYLKFVVNAVSWRAEEAPAVIKKIHKPGKDTPDPLHGLYETEIDGKPCVVEYEPDSELRDYEQIPLLEEGGIEAFFCREVFPYTPDAWIVEDDTKSGYEISFTRHFYQPPSLRTLE